MYRKITLPFFKRISYQEVGGAK